jgi:16S rRNA (adenine1518-N6/adenine1519-N6)-dimethyltransferase
MQLLARCTSVCAVPPRCFQPPPKVMSEVVRLDPLLPEERPEPALSCTVEQLLRRCFAARRKMLRNTLAGLLPTAELLQLAAAAGVQLEQRPQELAPERWLALAAGLNRATPSAAASAEATAAPHA